MSDDLRDAIAGLIPQLRRYAVGLCRDRDRADDLVQECLLRAIDHLDSFTPGTNLRAWLFTILRHAFLNTARHGERERGWASDEEERAYEPIIDAGQPHGVALRELARRVAGLSTDQREVLLLVAVEGLSYEEAASVLRIPIGTVRSRVNRARQALLRMEQADAALGATQGADDPP